MRRTPLAPTFLPVFLFHLVASAASASDYSQLLSYETAAVKFEQALATPALANAISSLPGTTPEVREEPLLVFIPGILGSKLTLPPTSGQENSGQEEIVWGCVNNAMTAHTSLDYSVQPKLWASPLFDPTAPTDDCAIDVYARFNTAMKSSALSKDGPGFFLNFSYDWRQSNEVSAKHFDEFIRREPSLLHGKDLVLIAHSMGGLIIKWWYHEYYSKDESVYPFNILRIFFVGTPHEGSYVTLDAMINGYKMFGESGTFAGMLSDTFFPALNKVGLTFPSFYELLPVASNSEHWVRYLTVYENTSQTDYIDLMDHRKWKALGLPDEDEVTIPSGGNGNLEEYYETLLPELLAGAKRFRDRLREMPPIPEARYVVSVKHETPNRLTARYEDNKLDLRLEFGEGDGTVFTDSALDISMRPKDDFVILIDSEHENLVNDENFIRKILMLRSSHSQGWEERFAAAAKNNERVVEAFANQEVYLPMGRNEYSWSMPEALSLECSGYRSAGQATCLIGEVVAEAINDPLRTDLYYGMALDSVGEFNAEVFRAVAKRRGVQVRELTRQLYMDAKAAEHPEFRSRGYENFISIERNLLETGEATVANFAWALNNLGHNMLVQGRKREAISSLKSAYNIGVRADMDRTFLNTVSRNIEFGKSEFGEKAWLE